MGRSWRATRPGRISRTELGAIALVLVGALSVISVLAYQAQAAFRSESAVANRALDHFATVAAWQFARAGRDELRMAAAATVGHRGHRFSMLDVDGRHPLSELRSIALDTTCECSRRAIAIEGFVRFDPATGRADVEPGLEVSPAAVAAAIRAEMADPQSPLAGGDDCALAIVRGQDSVIRALPFMVVRRMSGATTVYGAISSLAALGTVFERAAARATLLPTALLTTDEQRTSVALSATAGGTPVFRRGDGVLSAREWIGNRDRGFAIGAALAPSVAPRLLVGGLPRSRLPMVLVAGGVAIGLFVLAILLLARDASLTASRSDFVASASHELGTPVALIRAHAETLAREDAVQRAEHRRFLAVILRETRRLTGLVENLVHVSSSSGGPGKPRIERVALRELLEQAVADFAPMADTRRVRIELRVPEMGDVVADAHALTQMLFNLFSNAVKHGRSPGVIRVSARAEGARACVFVDDDGPGIPEAFRTVAFRRYSRAKTVDDGAPAGAGLGLAIVHELASQQDISVRIDDAPLGGARVVLEIPRAPRSAPAADDVVIASEVSV